MGIVTATNRNAAQKSADEEEKALPKVSLESQTRLAEILTDSPRLVNLAGTEWEIRALRLGTQHYIAKEVLAICHVENASFGDIFKEFAGSIDNVLNALTLALLNDKELIFKGGNEKSGFSELFYTTRDTLKWSGKVEEYPYLLLEVIQMVDINFFLTARDMLQMFRAQTTEMKRTRTSTQN